MTAAADFRTNKRRNDMAKFKVGDKVFFYGRPATVKQVIREPDADYILDVQGADFYAEDDEVTSRNSRACNSANPVVANAMNACGTARNAGSRDAYESAINQARIECYKAIRNEPDADDYSDVTALVKQAKALLDKAYRAI